MKIIINLKRKFFEKLRKIIDEEIIKLAKEKSDHFSLSLENVQEYNNVNQIDEESLILINQWLSILNREMNIPNPPPKHLQIRVAGGYDSNFIASGFNYFSDIRTSLNEIGKKIDSYKTILDFGCGCGRTIRAFKKFIPDADLYGIDIDEEAINWQNSNYSSFGKFYVSPDFPPTQFKNNTFDLIIGISVFTHLPEDMQFQWLEELNRIICNDGLIILTTHGEINYNKFPSNIIEIMNEKGFFYNNVNYGQSISLPDYYQNAYHSNDYINNKWGNYLTVKYIKKCGLGNHQDLIICTKKDIAIKK